MTQRKGEFTVILDCNSRCPDQECGGSTQDRGRTHQHC